MDRDAHNHAKLRDLGWTVITIWECRLQEDTCEALRFFKNAAVKGGEKVGHHGGGSCTTGAMEKELNWEQGGIRLGAVVRSPE